MNGYWITGLVAGVLGIAIGAGATHLVDAGRYGAQLEAERTAHAQDNERHAHDLTAMSSAALDAENRAIDAHSAAESRIAAADQQLTKERQSHEADNASFRARLAAGTERLRVAVTGCSAAGGDEESGAAGAAGMGDGAAAYAELDPAVAERVFRVAGDDDNEISKVKALQAYVCAVRLDTPGCPVDNR